MFKHSEKDLQDAFGFSRQDATAVITILKTDPVNNSMDSDEWQQLWNRASMVMRTARPRDTTPKLEEVRASVREQWSRFEDWRTASRGF